MLKCSLRARGCGYASLKKKNYHVSLKKTKKERLNNLSMALKTSTWSLKPFFWFLVVLGSNGGRHGAVGAYPPSCLQGVEKIQLHLKKLVKEKE